jgi:cytochrome b
MSGKPVGAARGTRIWDLPTRLVHWTLAALVVFSIITAKVGGLWMDWHMRSGYAILALVLFRVLWGFAGSHYARFASFVRAPAVVLAYLRGRIVHVAGHSPLGALSVIALLGVLLLQAAAGLFTNDGSFTEGPLARLASGATVDRLSTIHRYGEWVVFAMVGLHIAAIVYYSSVRGAVLVGPMITGEHSDTAIAAAEDGTIVRVRALVLAAIAAALVAYVVTL